jgi:quercetin dioxygenase-like cupin family protein
LSSIILLRLLLSCFLIFAIREIHKQLIFGYAYYIQEKDLRMKETEVIAQTDAIRIRIMALSPREIAAWHYHTQVRDHIFCLRGTILVRMRNPEKEVRLAPGERCLVEVQRIHQLENLEDFEASYLLIQGIGKYDFNTVD